MKFAKACETADTVELVGVRVEYKNTTAMTILHASLAGTSVEDFYNIVSMASNLKKATIGPYITEHYFDMFRQLAVIEDDIRFKRKNAESRQFVISFERLHCFQSIQFLIRGNTIFAIANMRSCNAKDNLAMDAALVAYCAQRIRSTGWQDAEIHVIMNIGSLHIFR